MKSSRCTWRHKAGSIPMRGSVPVACRSLPAFGFNSGTSEGSQEGCMENLMSHFFAYLSRMKFIKRWGLMHNTYPENIQEHSLRVATIAHALALIRSRVVGGHVNPERV